MTIRELLTAGQLGPAVDELSRQLRSKPTDISLRISLFELLCLSGDLDRAAKQLDVIDTQGTGPEASLSIQVYRDLLAAERLRRQVFDGDGLPKFLLTPPASVDAYLVMLKKLRTAPDEAVALLPEAEERVAPLAGSLQDRRFATFRDADDRLAPVLEVFHGPDYVWLPLEQIARLTIAEPTSLRDTIWARATVETEDQSVGEVVVPVLYVHTHLQVNDSVRLGRVTEWQLLQEQMVLGAGQRVFLVDDEEVGLLDVRDVRFGGAQGERGVGVSAPTTIPDVEALLAPVQADAPAGQDLRWQPAFDEITTARRAAEADPIELGPWRRVATLLVDATGRSKDLQLAVWLVDALVRLEGFSGAGLGLVFVRELLDRYWDAMHPRINPEDLEPLARRRGLLQWLDDRVPAVMKMVPLTGAPTFYGLLHYEVSQTTGEQKRAMLAEGWPAHERFIEALNTTAPDRLEKLLHDAQACQAHRAGLEASVKRRFTSSGADGTTDDHAEPVTFVSIKGSLDTVQWLLERTLKKTAPVVKVPLDTTGSLAGDAPTPAVATGEQAWTEALMLTRENRVDGLKQVQSQLTAASSGRDLFLRQLQLAELSLEAGIYSLALPLLEELARLVDARKLEEWEAGTLLAKVFSGLATCCAELKHHNASYAARETELRQRAARLLGAPVK